VGRGNEGWGVRMTVGGKDAGAGRTGPETQRGLQRGRACFETPPPGAPQHEEHF
jgi:hypothetical protein